MRESALHDTSVTKVNSAHSPRGMLGQKYLASGTSISMRLWDEPPSKGAETTRPYETVGYVVSGRALLHLEGQVVRLDPGDSWVVPKNSVHRYEIIERFVAVEATHPPAQAHARDEH
jgi:quercetin dioxygenase-like cupin family protein